MAKKSHRVQQQQSRKYQRVSRRVQEQQRMLTYAVIAFAALIFGILGYGALDQYVLRYRRPVAKVNGEAITGREFVLRARLRRGQLINQIQQTIQFMQLFGNDPQTSQFFLQQLSQFKAELDSPVQLGQTVLNQLIDEKLIIQEAKRRGITVTDEEIDQELASSFGYFPNGTPTPTMAPTVRPTSTLSPTQLALVTLTPTPTEGPTATPTVTPTAGPSPTPRPPTPTATPYTAEAFQQNLQDYYASMTEQYGFTQEELRALIAASLYRQKLRDALTADLPREQEQVWARHILVDDEKTALEILARLANGEDFGELAKNFSKDAGSAGRGGDLGWFGRGVMVKEFEDAAFSLKVGEISQPVKTNFGWHIIQVLGHEKRPLSDAEYEQLRDDTFQKWLQEARDQADIEIIEGWQNLVPTEPALPPELEALFQQ